MTRVDGYNYSAFFAGAILEHGRFCWVHAILLARRTPASTIDPGVPLADDPLMQACEFQSCDEQKRTLTALPALDCHHLVPKQRLKREFPRGAVLVGGGDGPFELRVIGKVTPVLMPGEVGRAVSLGEVLSDWRWGVPVCRLHHDRLERGLVRLQRHEVPAVTEEAAAQFEVGWSLDRDYGERHGVTAEPREAA